ncbi:hypothetical protein FRB99_004209 [Tulasnella sp. 403]|nr:hypothetical protein FRB99_004209 [Tulasnella sp. 403]
MGVSYDTMFRILQVAGTLYSPLFPRLRHLTVTASYQFNKPLNDVVNLFAEYPLLSITLPCCNYITPFTKGWTVNLCLPDLFTKDRSQIRHFESELVIDPTQYSLATSLPRLEVLRYNCVPTRALWLEMGRLPNLTQLRVNVGQRQDTLTSEDLVLFPILRQLSIFLDEQSGTLPNNILLRTSMPSLRRLCIESCNDIEDMTAVCQHLKKHSPLLDSFELYAFGFVRTREIAQQTLQLKGLRRLTLGLDADTAIMDDDIVALAPLMTRLEMLSIWAMGVWVSKTSLMTVKGIITLAEHALCLVDLCITLDVRRFEIQEMSQNPPSFPRLKSLRLGIHRDSDTRHEACAGFLARVCPTVEYLHLPRGPTLRNSDEQRDWDEGFRSEYWAAREKG